MSYSIAAAMKPTLNVVGLGEVLWDLLPGGKQLGGAPTNFAYMCSLLGHRAVVASRVGRDPLGDELTARLKQLGLATDYLQIDERQPTGTVQVEVDATGSPRFTIIEPVAWDFLDWTPTWEELVRRTDVVCFGTLAQRSATSRAAIRRFVQAVPGGALRVFDVNLRQGYFTADVLAESLRMADVVKLNHEELPVVAKLLGLDSPDELAGTRNLLHKYGVKLVCVTRGAGGSLIVDSENSSVHPGFKVRIADTVGAGDAFTACLAHHYLAGASLDEINTAANRFAAWVATQPGGTPALHGRSLAGVLGQIRS